MTHELVTVAKSTEFLWIPGYVSIDGNETANQLTKKLMHKGLMP